MKLKPESLLAVGSEYLMASWKNEEGSQVIAIYRDLTKDGITNYMLGQPPRGDYPDGYSEFKALAYDITFKLMDAMNDPDKGLEYISERWIEQGGKVYLQ